MASTRVTRVLKEDKALEEFIAVEKALTKSPYILPQDVVNSSTRNEVVESETRKQETGTILGPANEMEEDLLPEPEVSESERDGLVDLVEGYSRDDDAETQSPQSSPFVEHTKPAKLVDRDLPLSPVPHTLPQTLASPILSPQPMHEESDKIDPIEGVTSGLLDNYTEKSTTLQPIPVENDDDQIGDPTDPPLDNNTIQKSTPSQEEERLLATQSESTVTRMPSIQRRGQEYLAQFLAKQKSKSSTSSSSSSTKPHSAPPHTPERNRQSLLTVILYIGIFVSLIGNIFLITKVYQLQTDMLSPEMRLDKIMKPGRVGETFEIFTSPSSNWRIWMAQKKENVEVESPALPPQVDTVKIQTWSISNILSGQPKVDVPENTAIGHTVMEEEEEGMLQTLLGETQIFIYGIVVKILRL